MEPFNTGKWNYTEEIEYKVISVRLIENVQQPYHWQNAFAGQHRQIVFVKYGAHTFAIDNEDGSGILKILNGGGPDMYSAHVADYHYVCDVPKSDWIPYSVEKCKFHQRAYDIWMEAHHPAKLKEVQMLRDSINKGRLHINKRGHIAFGERPAEQTKRSKSRR